jgi:uncharacterized protein (TIGR02421 family)
VTNKKTKIISEAFVEEICKRLEEGKQLRRSLPVWGRVHIDRQLPFLCIYRKRKNQQDLLSEGLITGEASYLTASENRNQNKQLSFLVKSIAKTLKKSFGSFLIVEVWVSDIEGQKHEGPNYNASFKIVRPKNTEVLLSIQALEKSLKEIKIRRNPAEVSVSIAKVARPGLPALITQAEAKQLGIHMIGIEVDPIYLSGEDNGVFPIVYRNLKRGFSRALKNSFYEFTRNNTQMRPPHYQFLGRRSMVKAVWDVDEQFAAINKGFDFLLQVTPVNTNNAWSSFKRSKFKKAPLLVYRPLPVDPALAKRQLFQVPIERIEDPTLAQLFREQQIEMDRKYTMLIDRGTPRFLYGSLQLYGTVSKSLLGTAEDILKQISPRSRDESTGRFFDATEFAARATEKLEDFRKIYPAHPCQVHIKENITGLMVSEGNLLIGKQSKLREERVDALIAHEVETHVLTYLNGKSQRLHLLYTGFPGYDELQEGLAVLSEYMVGGLTGRRLRLLAARVIAARMLIDGASFAEVFHELNSVYGFERRTAFNITIRIYRGGGLTKDAIYLRGLVQLLAYLKNGGDLEPLFVGKISAHHIQVIKELQWRKIIHPAMLRPAFLDDKNSTQKLNDLRNGLDVINLINRRKK